MNALNAIRGFIRRRPPAERKLAKPDPAYGKPREMTGFLAGLTEEQRKAALTPVDPDRAGDPSKVR